MANSTDRAYLERVRSYQQRFPATKFLSDFAKSDGGCPVRAAVIEFKDEHVHVQMINSIQELKDYWIAVSSSDCRQRLYLVEDLSPPWVEALGAHFHLEPSLFASYAYTPNWTSLNDRQMIRGLPSAQRNSVAFTLKYYETRVFGEAAPDPKEVQIQTKANIPRHIVVGQRSEMSEPHVGMVRRNCSFWLKKDARSGNWDGVLLVDPRVQNSILEKDWSDYKDTAIRPTEMHLPSELFLHGYSDFTPWQHAEEFHGIQGLQGPPRTGVFDDVIFFWKYAATKEEVAVTVQNPKNMFSIPKKIIGSHWMMTLEYVSAILSQCESKLWNFERLSQSGVTLDVLTEELENLQQLLTHINAWRRRIWWYISDMNWDLEVLGASSTTAAAEPHRKESLAETELREDFSVMFSRLYRYKERVDSLMPVVTGAFSLLDAQRALREARFAVRITKVAFLFVPLSSITGLFSMSDQFRPGGDLLWIPLAIAGALMLCIFFFAFTTAWARPSRWISTRMRHVFQHGKYR